jgi:hypothetical protein
LHVHRVMRGGLVRQKSDREAREYIVKSVEVRRTSPTGGRARTPVAPLFAFLDALTCKL